MVKIIVGSIALATLFLSERSEGACHAKSREIGSGEFKVQVSEYESSGERGTLLILPPTGGSNILDRSYASLFCENGFRVFILEHWTGDDEHSYELEIHQRFYARSSKAIGLVVAEIKDGFIGIFGTSVGALHTAVATGLEERIRAAFVVVGGSPIAEVIATSDQGAMVDAKKKRFEKYGFKNETEYEEALDRVLPLEPQKPVMNYKGKIFGMVVSTRDTTVPTKTQRTLQALWNPEVLFEFSNDHFFSILKTWFWLRDDIVEFFKKASASR